MWRLGLGVVGLGIVGFVANVFWRGGWLGCVDGSGGGEADASLDKRDLGFAVSRWVGLG